MPPPPPVPTTIETSVNSAIMYTFKLGSVDGYSAKRNFFRVTVRYDLNVFPFLKPWCTLIKSWHFPPITKSVHFIHLSLLIIYKRKRLMAF